jgi:hypothetical protein
MRRLELKKKLKLQFSDMYSIYNFNVITYEMLWNIIPNLKTIFQQFLSRTYFKTVHVKFMFRMYSDIMACFHNLFSENFTLQTDF